MGKHAVRSLIAISVTAAAALLLRGDSAADPVASPAVFHGGGCKPMAPIAFTLVGSRVHAGVLAFDYEVTSGLDAAALDTEIDPSSDGGTVLSGARVAAVSVKRGDAFAGNGRVRLPSGKAGGRVTVRAHVTFMGAEETPSGETQATSLETSTADFVIEWGDATPHADNVALVTTAGTTSLDCPAIRVGGAR